jgi:hypothetical protein
VSSSIIKVIFFLIKPATLQINLKSLSELYKDVLEKDVLSVNDNSKVDIVSARRCTSPFESVTENLILVVAFSRSLSPYSKIKGTSCYTSKLPLP